MSYNYKHLVLAFMEFCGDKHGASFDNEDIETLKVDGQPASGKLIADIKKRATEIAAGD